MGLVRFFKVNGTWGLEGGVSRRMVKKNSFDDHHHKLTFFFEVNLPYILWVTAYNTSFLLFCLGLDMWLFSVGDSGGKITKHHKKGDAPPPPVTQIQFGNPPPLLDLINRHSLEFFLLVNTFFLSFDSYVCVKTF